MERSDHTSKWELALTACTKSDYDLALKTYAGIADQPLISFNIGSIHKHLANYDDAIEYFTLYIIDQRECPLGYFERASCFFHKRNFKMAASDFSKAQMIMKNNAVADYSSRGMNVKLFLCEVLYNLANCYKRLDCVEKSEKCLLFASKFIINDMQDGIIGAFSKFGYGHDLFRIDECAQFPFTEIKLKEIKRSDGPITNNSPISPHHRSSSESRIQVPSQVNQKIQLRHKSVILEKLSDAALYENITKEPQYTHSLERAGSIFQPNMIILKVRISSDYIMMAVNVNSRLDLIKKKIQEKLGNIGKRHYSDMLLLKDGLVICSDRELRNLMLQKKILDLVVQPDVVDFYFEL